MRGGQVNNSVCLRLSAVSRFWVARRLATASANHHLSRPSYRLTHTHLHTHWESYCHGNQLLYDYSLLRRIIGTNLSQPLPFIVSFSPSLFLVFYKPPPLSTALSPLPLPLLSPLHVSDSREFDLSCIIWPRWDLYSSHKCKSKTLAQADLHKHCISCFQRETRLKWGFEERMRKKYLGKNRKLFGSVVCYFSLKHRGVWGDFPWVTHCFLWTCSRQVIFY